MGARAGCLPACLPAGLLLAAGRGQLAPRAARIDDFPRWPARPPAVIPAPALTALARPLTILPTTRPPTSFSFQSTRSRPPCLDPPSMLPLSVRLSEGSRFSAGLAADALAMPLRTPARPISPLSPRTHSPFRIACLSRRFQVPAVHEPPGRSVSFAFCPAALSCHLTELSFFPLQAPSPSPSALLRSCSARADALTSATARRTIFFWAPLAKWSLVIAGLKDINRPVEKVSVNSNLGASPSFACASGL